MTNDNVVEDIKNVYSMSNLSNKDVYAGLDLEIEVILHEDIKHIWHRKNCIQIYYTSPEEFL